MKRLLLIWFFSGSLDGIGQSLRLNDILKSPVVTDSLIKATSTPEGPMFIAAGSVVWINPPARTDTLRSVLLVTGRPPAFTHAVYGYCVKKNGDCVGHLDSRYRLFKLPVRVWGCDNNQNRKR